MTTKTKPTKPGTTVGQKLNGFMWNGRKWVEEKIQPLPLQSVVGRIMSTATPQQIIGGVQKGDTTAAAYQKELAARSSKHAGRVEADEQKARQKAGRDFRVEADKDAAARAASEYNQKMSQISGAAGGGAAALASMNVKDPTATLQTHMARQDEQQTRAEDLASQAEAERQESVRRQFEAERHNEIARDESQHNLAARSLSTATSVEPAVSKNPEEVVEEEETPAEPKSPQIQDVQAVRRANNAVGGIRGKVTDDELQQEIENFSKAFSEGDEAWKKYAADFNTRYRLTGKNAASLSRTESTAGAHVGKWSGETGEIVPSDSRIKHIIEAVNRRF
ncbi:MAG TPA: hypothetical protein PLM50_02315 [Rectinema sp.]|nr:hypothetical protein [Rectinema sp.]